MISLVKYRKSGGSFDNKRKENEASNAVCTSKIFTTTIPGFVSKHQTCCEVRMSGEPEHRTLFEGTRRLIFIRPSPVFSSCGYLVNITGPQHVTRTSQLHYSI